ncbi:Sema domain,IPT domain,Immunoglobulin E-set,Immunoglobulin-like fold,Plexin repeat,WD40/YVTN [Cinara cedri]|uniref:Sema domain,IPT domain,Immunoglobulin E-set,Immunoglobulin-like fold,Plexin repeat,WD40/YVTN n=1 Tax=Cinara cedri TaxID=506608 RepID=A0A5E4NES5_9HEMI|nr:Sema domain,IPT domain,Immunoglobulin E-set,Immunoglobulin-like fold,Plexin repeat,WD40/YVTN [Cinara cedri]
MPISFKWIGNLLLWSVGNLVMRNSKLCFMFMLFLITITLKCSSAMSVVAKYPHNIHSECFSNHLLHMAVDKNSGGRVYIGAVNKIIQLEGLNLTVETCTKTGPLADSPQCPSSGCSSIPSVQTSLTDNYNKILIIDLESRMLIACGSILQGACNKYKLSNVSYPAQFFPVSIAANTKQDSTFAFIGPNNSNDHWGFSNILYVGTTFTKNGDFRHAVPAISSRNLYNLDLVENSFKQSFININNNYRDHFLVKYIYGFNSSDYAYFVVVQKLSYLPGQEESGYVTRLARVCIADANYDSYTEVTLQCLVNDTLDSDKLINYNLAQDLKLSNPGEDLAISLGISTNDQVLVGSFSPSQGITNEPKFQSAVCVFSMQYIESKFNENIHMCFNGTIKYRNMAYISGPILQGNCPAAGSTGNILNFCEVGLRISGTQPISKQAAIQFPNHHITSVTLATTEKNTILFLGTSTGILKKVLLSSATYGINYEELILDNGYSILPDTSLTTTGEHLYVLTQSNVLKVRVEHCNSFTNCSACLEANDPYCGWCSLERRCTIRTACQKAIHSSPRWLSLGTGQQCIDFEQINPDRIAIHQMAKLHLMIKTLPELPAGAKYRCVFGSDPLDAIVTPFGLQCLTPKIESRPNIPKDQDHIYVSLSVRSSETNKDFVSRSFAYFDCNAHTRCLECVKSQWACNWCVYENKCTNNISMCQPIIISGENNPSRLKSHGASFCPRFVQPAQKILLPNGVPKDIVLQVENLPTPQVGHTGFQCIISIEGAKLMVPARVEEKHIVCDKTTYSYEANSGEYDAIVSMVWNRNHQVDTINVTLYKCDILGSHREHPDCSLCVTRNRIYNCTWCNTNKMSACVYSETCLERSSYECPKPRIDMIKPLSGPIEGGTLVTIEGSNLGLNETDVRDKIHIGDILCHLVDYEISVKIVCKTGPSFTEKVSSIVVGNNAGKTESSVHFSYKNVKLDKVTPVVGPQSGGTILAINGHNLNIGSSVIAFLDNFPCKVNTTHASSTRLTCITSAATKPQTINAMHLIIDGSNRSLTKPFTYKNDPTIAEIKPLISFLSGGRMITVHGTNFDIIQKPEMVVYMDSDFFHFINKTECIVLNSAQMECPSPSANSQFLRNIKSSIKRRRHAFNGKYEESSLILKIGFIMDNVATVKDLEKHLNLLQYQIKYVQDPKYFEFPNTIKSYKGDTLVIEGENLNLACDESDVYVTVGLEICNVTSLANSQLVCIPPEYQPKSTDDIGAPTRKGLPLVVVRVGKKLRFNVGYLQYDVLPAYSFSPEAIAGAVTGAICIIIIFFIILFLYRRKSTQAEREYKRIQIQMDTLESNVRSECKQAFAELQTDMTDLTADLESSGIPTLDHHEYILKVFFPGVRDHPILNESKVVIAGSTTNYDAAMLQFEQLINNKHFVLSFIDTLESQKTFSIRDKVNVASLLMVVLMNKMEYATDVLRSLLLRLIDKSVMSKHPHLMLRRTESVVEKMLTNWMALNMYKYLKDYAGSSLFLLYKAIKHQVEKGPVDALTYDARYSLSEDRLLREKIDHRIVNLYVVQDNSVDKMLCKVLDCDTISQVKSKILDAMYKNTAFSLRPSVYDVDLEWRHGRGGHLTLQDYDVTTKNVCGWKKLNTLAHYGVKDTAIVTLISRQHDTYNKTCLQSCHNCTYYSGAIISNSNGSIDPSSSSNSTVYHLIRSTDTQQQYHTNKMSERIHKAIPEIYLTRLLSTKGTIQKFVDDFFSTILAANETLPTSVKWLFDLFDDAAKKYNIIDPEVVHSWKSNSLPLRFWVNFIKNPDFIFDIDKTPTVDSCLSVIAQTFMDSCSTSDHRLGKDSPSNKLLFAKDIPQYRETVLRFYSNIQKLPKITDQELSTYLQQMSVSHLGQFHIVSALKELYIYASKYNDAILNSLELDPCCQKLNLSHKLNKVAGTLEGESAIC